MQLNEGAGSVPAGFQAIVVNQRGAALPQVTTNIFNISHLQDDLDDVLDKNALLVLSDGYLMDVFVVLKFAAASQHAPLIKGIAIVDNPFDFYRAAHRLLLPHALYVNQLLDLILASGSVVLIVHSKNDPICEIDTVLIELLQRHLITC